ncbi:hypothetical protein ACGFMM_33635 [Streptomyces sp. NPDC048604]|uniref:hypothetical protein n=1 Tax=Streptomyces sp. NPDC048604 TaxID=3365578 RepID=UPI003712DB93
MNQLEVGAVTLAGFRARIERLLGELDRSAANPGRLADSRVAAEAYGRDFAAATELHTSYATVRARLEALSRTFGDTIESMGIAIHIADRGYADVDDDLRRRFAELQRRAREQYAQGGEQPVAKHTETSATGGFR